MVGVAASSTALFRAGLIALRTLSECFSKSWLRLRSINVGGAASRQSGKQAGMHTQGKKKRCVHDSGRTTPSVRSPPAYMKRVESKYYRSDLLNGVVSADTSLSYGTVTIRQLVRIMCAIAGVDGAAATFRRECQYWNLNASKS
ncbi:hypothetical protein MRX96_045405 [Rhipicephalus microplus]